MESNLLLEQYSWYKKQQLAKSPFKCLLNADIEPKSPSGQCLLCGHSSIKDRRHHSGR